MILGRIAVGLIIFAAMIGSYLFAAFGEDLKAKDEDAYTFVLIFGSIVISVMVTAISLKLLIVTGMV